MLSGLASSENCQTRLGRWQCVWQINTRARR